ncbi:MAG: transporter substrate-binding domain-containing protein [Roseomonas sp.]|nr:transporter substrate-binding domain-containing protein [Roseomonas sp.]
MRSALLGFLALAGIGFAAPVQAQAQGQNPVLDGVRQRGEVRCGVFGLLPGFSAPDAQGVMRGLDADFCRAVAAAVLGDAAKVRFVTAPSLAASLEAVERAEVDILSSNLTATALRDAGRNLVPVGVLFYDGQGVMVRADADIAAFRQLDGKRICVAAPAVDGSLAILHSAATRMGVSLTPVPVAQGGPALIRAFRAGECDGVSADAAALATLKATDLPDPASAVVLPERLSREPLTPFVPGHDNRWRQVVAWTLHALVAAEELEVTSGSLEAAIRSDDTETRFLLGVDPGLGQALGLPDTWAMEAVRQVGNYGEIFDRNLGEGSPIGLDRGLSDLWLRGGLMYPFPFR